jgi:hypothetical protein
MTTQEFTQIAIEKFSQLSTEELKSSAIIFSRQFSTTADLMGNAIMDILIERMNERDFINFCNQL